MNNASPYTHNDNATRPTWVEVERAVRDAFIAFLIDLDGMTYAHHDACVFACDVFEIERSNTSSTRMYADARVVYDATSDMCDRAEFAVTCNYTEVGERVFVHDVSVRPHQF